MWPSNPIPDLHICILTQVYNSIGYMILVQFNNVHLHFPLQLLSHSLVHCRIIMYISTRINAPHILVSKFEMLRAYVMHISLCQQCRNKITWKQRVYILLFVFEQNPGDLVEGKVVFHHILIQFLYKQKWGTNILCCSDNQRRFAHDKNETVRQWIQTQEPTQ